MGISRPLYVGVNDPNDPRGGVHMDYYNDWARLRIGGTGVGVQNGFQLAGPSETILLETDMQGLTTTPGGLTTPKDVIGRATISRGYQTSSASSSYQNYWTRIASITLTAQYTDGFCLIDMMGNGGGSDASSGRIYFRVKQQNALGGAPNVYLRACNLVNMTEANLKAVTTTNSTSQTVVQLWLQNPYTYQLFAFVPVLEKGCVFDENYGYVSSYPGGAVASCVNLDHYNQIALPLNNSWVNFGSGYVNAQASNIGNVIKIEGMIKGGTVTSGTTIATLPSGWNPSTRQIFMCPTGNNASGICRIDVLPTGAINISDSQANNAWISLSPVIFTI